MADTIVQLSGVALVLIPIVVALTSITKVWVTDTRWAPFISLAFGIALSYLAIPATVQAVIITGIMIGLSASGLYSVGSKTVDVVKG